MSKQKLTLRDYAYGKGKGFKNVRTVDVLETKFLYNKLSVKSAAMPNRPLKLIASGLKTSPDRNTAYAPTRVRRFK
jgi:hypothetical protein